MPNGFVDGRVGPQPVHPRAAYLACCLEEADVMGLAGWQSRQMVRRHGTSAAQERAFDTHRRLSPPNRT